MRKTLTRALAGAAILPLATAAAAQDGAAFDVRVIVPALDARFWNGYVRFMETGAEELGVNLTVLNADNKPDQMIRSLEGLAARLEADFPGGVPAHDVQERSRTHSPDAPPATFETRYSR